MRTNITCCLNCSERHPGCHSECERYLQQRKELDKTRQEKKDNPSAFTASWVTASHRNRRTSKERRNGKTIGQP